MCSHKAFICVIDFGQRQTSSNTKLSSKGYNIKQKGQIFAFEPGELLKSFTVWPLLCEHRILKVEQNSGFILRIRH